MISLFRTPCKPSQLLCSLQVIEVETLVGGILSKSELPARSSKAEGPASWKLTGTSA